MFKNVTTLLLGTIFATAGIATFADTALAQSPSTPAKRATVKKIRAYVSKFNLSSPSAG